VGGGAWGEKRTPPRSGSEDAQGWWELCSKFPVLEGVIAGQIQITENGKSGRGGGSGKCRKKSGVEGRIQQREIESFNI